MSFRASSRVIPDLIWNLHSHHRMTLLIFPRYQLMLIILISLLKADHKSLPFFKRLFLHWRRNNHHKIFGETMHKQLLTLLCAFSLTYAANTHKTFLRRRTDSANIGMMWATHTHPFSVKNYDGTVSLTPFFRQSLNRNDIGNYFTGGKINKIFIAAGGDDDPSDNIQALYGHMIDHSPAYDIANPATSAPMYGNITLRPEYWAIGSMLQATQPLNKIAKGLAVHVALPLIHEETQLNPLFNDTPSNVITADGEKKKTLSHFFSGTLLKNASQVSQQQLKHAKLLTNSSSDTQTSQTGLGDMLFELTYRALTMKQFHIDCGASIVLPTGNSVSNEYLFSPQLGNNGHAELGLSAQLVANSAIEKLNTTLQGIVGIDYKLSMNATERRIMGIYSAADKQEVYFAHYRMMMQDGKPGVFPGANILEQKVSVSPKNQLQILAGMTGQHQQWRAQLGYTFYYRQAETVALSYSHEWHNDAYAFANRKYNMLTSKQAIHENKIGGSDDYFVTILNPGGLNDEDKITTEYETVSFYGPIQIESTDPSLLPIRYAADDVTSEDPNVSDPNGKMQASSFNLSPTVCTTTEQQIHTLIAAVDYTLEKEFPLTLGAGISLDIASNTNTTPKQWSFWAHVSSSF